jgi:hypothetical protein
MSLRGVAFAGRRSPADGGTTLPTVARNDENWSFETDPCGERAGVRGDYGH